MHFVKDAVVNPFLHIKGTQPVTPFNHQFLFHVIIGNRYKNVKRSQHYEYQHLRAETVKIVFLQRIIKIVVPGIYLLCYKNTETG
jgi:hypothetical protein